MKITRRYGTPPAQRGCGQNNSCPDVLGLDSGDYLVIGKVPSTRTGITAKELIKHAAGIGVDEQAVVVPGEVMEAAARDIAISPAYARLQEAAKNATEAAHAHAMHAMKAVYQLCRQYGDDAIPADEVLRAMGMDKNANILGSDT